MTDTTRINESSTKSITEFDIIKTISHAENEMNTSEKYIFEFCILSLEELSKKLNNHASPSTPPAIKNDTIDTLGLAGLIDHIFVNVNEG